MYIGAGERATHTEACRYGSVLAIQNECRNRARAHAGYMCARLHDSKGGGERRRRRYKRRKVKGGKRQFAERKRFMYEPLSLTKHANILSETVSTNQPAVSFASPTIGPRKNCWKRPRRRGWFFLLSQPPVVDASVIALVYAKVFPVIFLAYYSCNWQRSRNKRQLYYGILQGSHTAMSVWLYMDDFQKTSTFLCL